MVYFRKRLIKMRGGAKEKREFREDDDDEETISVAFI